MDATGEPAASSAVARGSTPAKAVPRKASRAKARPAAAPAEPVTVGVAISIPRPWAEVLDAVRASSGDPLATFIPAHLTLLGPTDVGADQLDDVEAQLAVAAAAQAPFAVHLRGTGTFRPVTEVVFVAVAAGISECEVLATDVRRGPLMRELSYPYHPHVTIAHDVPTDALDRVYAELADFEALFTADYFTLFVHGSDGHWRPIRDFKLSGDPMPTAPSIETLANAETQLAGGTPPTSKAKRKTAAKKGPAKKGPAKKAGSTDTKGSSGSTRSRPQ